MDDSAVRHLHRVRVGVFPTGHPGSSPVGPIRRCSTAHLTSVGESAPTYSRPSPGAPYWPRVEPLSEFFGPLLSVIPERFQESSQAT